MVSRAPIPSRREVPGALRWVAVWRRNQRVWRKLAVPSLLGNFGEPFLYLLALGYGLGSFVGQMNDMPYLVFLASGIVVSSTMVTTSFEATYSAYSRMAVQRNWDAMLAAPLDVRDVVLGEVIWAASKGLISSTAILVIAVLLGAVDSWQALWIPPLAFLTGLCYASMAMVVTVVSRSYEFFLYYSTLVITPMLLLSGVFFPVERMPSLIQRASDFLPLTHSVEVSRMLMTGAPSGGTLIHLAVLAGTAVGFFLVSTRLAMRRLSN